MPGSKNLGLIMQFYIKIMKAYRRRLSRRSHVSRLLCLGDSEFRENGLGVAVTAINTEVVARIPDKRR